MESALHSGAVVTSCATHVYTAIRWHMWVVDIHIFSIRWLMYVSAVIRWPMYVSAAFRCATYVSTAIRWPNIGLQCWDAVRQM